MTLMLADEDDDTALATRDAAPIANPFGKAPAPAQAAAAVEGQRAIAEVQAALFIAQQNPRNERLAWDRIINACGRESLAKSAIYSYARGGSAVTGPSIRLAEAIAQRWGNLSFGIRELEQRSDSSVVEAFTWDVESNTRSVKVFTVPHYRHTKNGKTRLTDPRDIYELVANNGARRLRACILAVIPGDVTEAAVKACEATMRASVKITPELLERTLAKFAKHGVTKEAIEKFIQRRFDSITPALVVRLGTIYTSLEDGMSTAAEWFELAPATAITGGTKADSLAAKLQAKAAPTIETPAPAEAPPAPTEAPQPASKAKAPPAYLRSMIDAEAAARKIAPSDAANIEARVLNGAALTKENAPLVMQALKDVAGE